MNLNAKQRVFLETYLRTWNATRAAEAAGYSHPNKQGPRLLVHVGIQAAIRERLNELQMGADEVLIRLGQQARFDPLRFATINDEGLTAIDLAALREAGLGCLVKKISYDKSGNQVVEFHDGQAALRLIGQHHRLFVMRTENLDIDYSKLNDDQLQRIANGEDPIQVLLSDAGGGGN